MTDARGARRWMIALLLFAPVRLALGADAEEILRQAVEASERLRSYRCKLRMEVKGSGGDVASFGELSFLRPGFLKMRSSLKMPAGESIEVLTVSDGQFSYTETKAGPGVPPMVSKNPVTASGAGAINAGASVNAPSEMLVQFQKLFDLNLEESTDRKIEGQAMATLIGRYRKGSLEQLMKTGDSGEKASESMRREIELFEGLMSTVRLVIGREDHFLHQIELNPRLAGDAAAPKSELPSVTTTFFDLVLDAPLAPGDFAYLPPSNAQITETAPAAAGSKR